MTKKEMSSRQRLLAALSCQEPDYPPCSLMLYKGLKSICQDYAPLGCTVRIAGVWAGIIRLAHQQGFTAPAA